MLRILIADDHAIVRRALKQMILEEYPGSEIGEAENAEDLIKKNLAGKWDLVICDINMPGRSGLDALKQIKHAYPRLPVLIMSMFPEEQYAYRVIKAGAAGYLSKNTIHDDLIKAIQKVLSGKNYITPEVAEKLAEVVNAKNEDFSHELLSDREFEVFKLLASGFTISEIGDKLAISSTTVSTYRTRVLKKMNLQTNTQLARYAYEKGLL